MTVSSPQPRPLSPHLGIYKPQISTVMSILHRATGVGLALGLPLLVIWLLMLASGSDVYEFFTTNIKSIVGQIVLVLGFFLLAFLVSVTVLIRTFKPSELVKWIVIILDFVIAASVTAFIRDYLTENDSEILDKICAPIGLIALIGWTWAFFYHFCCGIRHLIWDAGWFLSIKGMHVTGWITVILSAALTIGVWLKIYGVFPAGVTNGIIS